jgi:hypothetical protein
MMIPAISPEHTRINQRELMEQPTKLYEWRSAVREAKVRARAERRATKPTRHGSRVGLLPPNT